MKPMRALLTGGLACALAALLSWQIVPAETSAYVRVCGTSLCIHHSRFILNGATAYGTYDQPAQEVRLAIAAHLNTLAIVEFETRYHDLSDTMSAATWSRVDRFIAEARAHQLHVVLTLSSYAQSLQRAGINPTRTDWLPYLSFIANRVNTVTGVRYKDDPTIALVQLWAEICAPAEADATCPAGTSGTTAEIQDFYHRSLTEWHAVAPNILASTGGFSHLNTPDASAIPWQQVMSDPSNPLCEFEVNSPADQSVTVARVTRYCTHIGKPWFLAAWSSCYQDPAYSFYLPTDDAMAAHAAAMYRLANGNAPAASKAVGAEFWNLRDEGRQPTRCDLGPAFPRTFTVIQHGLESQRP